MSKEIIYRDDAIDAARDWFNGLICGSFRGLEKRLKSLPPVQPEPQWIPCSKRLPEDKYVLISKKSTKLSGSKWCVTIAIRMADPRSRKVNWRDIGFDVIQDNEVLAWMPLPEPARLENDQWEK